MQHILNWLIQFYTNVLQTSLVYISLGTQLVLSSPLSSYPFTLQCSSQSELISNKTCDQTAWKLHCYPYYLVVLFLQKQLNNKGFTLKQVVIYILSVYTMYVITRCSTRFVVQLYRGPFYWVCCFVELRFMYQTPKPMYISYARHPNPCTFHTPDTQTHVHFIRQTPKPIVPTLTIVYPTCKSGEKKTFLTCVINRYMYTVMPINIGSFHQINACIVHPDKFVVAWKVCIEKTVKRRIKNFCTF